ncbi:MAG TPA: Asp-tRNA(Asn)/Glu-tRNA(Gln) amidotransferase subunit GatA [Alcanivoracaceae bacterium]|nr:Asp-tRNA(Asn)/Glu-tRNA(Gln) amidotransferase subunit GatA [Alcanivoracaceae bacterium]
MHQKTLTQLQQGLERGDFSATELAEHYLARIEAQDKTLNSFITVTAEVALAQAKAADKARAAGQAGPLTGLPIAHKDMFCTKNIRTSSASRMLDNFLPPYDATVVERLQQAGMVMLGKTNMDELAMGSSSETSFYGPVKNPWDTERVPGGSSGGSAAAVAARLTPAATGSDTGGSIRQPSALTGITGLKPTYGRISRWGMVALASSLDHAGPMATTAADCALLLGAMAGHDEKDGTSATQAVPDYTAALTQPISGLRIGVPEQLFSAALSDEVATPVRAALAALEAQGATIVDISLPCLEWVIPTYTALVAAEAASNLARLDGVRFGHQCDNPKDIEDLYRRSRSEGFGLNVQERILLGNFMLSTKGYDKYYVQAQKVRRMIADAFNNALNDVDVIFGPTTPTTAFPFADKEGPVAMNLSDTYTIGANLAGLPALSLPVGFSQGLPVGAQLIGRAFDEARLLQVAHQYQQHTDWHTQQPTAMGDA